MDFSLRKLAWIFCTRLKRLETLERRLKNFETLFRTSDLEFVVPQSSIQERNGQEKQKESQFQIEPRGSPHFMGPHVGL